MQVQWAQARKPTIFPLYRPLVDGGGRVNNSLNQTEIELPQTNALLTTLSTPDDIFTRSIPTRPTTTTNIYALETYGPPASTGLSSCCSRSQMVAILSVCVVSLALIIRVRSLPFKSKINPISDSSRPTYAKINEEVEYVPRPSELAQNTDSDSESSEGGGVRLPNRAEEGSPVSETPPAHADPLRDAASFPSTLRGGRRNVSVHWHREHAREVKEHERHEKMKRMTKDWRLRAVD